MGNQALSIVIALIGVSLAVCATVLYAHARHRSQVFESLFENGPAAAILDADFKIRRINPAFTRLFGHSRQDVKGQPIDSLILPAGSRSDLKSHAPGLARGEAFDSETSLLRKGGAPFSSLATYIPARVNGDRIVLAMYREIAPDRTSASLANLPQRLIEMQEFERRRLARELHDDFGQSLTGLKMLLRAGETSPAQPLNGRIDQARVVVEELISGVRRMAFDLRPADLDHLGLVPALAALFDRFTARTELRVNLEQELSDRRLPPCVETAAYRIVQEALTNAARHSGAKSVNVRLRMDSARLQIEVEDRGAGFDPKAAMETPEASGLAGIRERASLLGGHMNVDSSPGCGTTICVELPVDVA